MLPCAPLSAGANSTCDAAENSRAARNPAAAAMGNRALRAPPPPSGDVVNLGAVSHPRAGFLVTRLPGFTPRIRRRVVVEGAAGSEELRGETQTVFSKSPRARGVSATSPGNAIWPRVLRAILPPRRPSRRTISASRVETARTRHHLARSCGCVMRFTPESRGHMWSRESRRQRKRESRARFAGGRSPPPLSLSLRLFLSVSSPPSHVNTRRQMRPTRRTLNAQAARTRRSCS